MLRCYRYRRKAADLLMAAGMGWRAVLSVHATFSSDARSAPGRSFQTAESVCIADTSDARGFVIPDVLKEHGIVSLANVPIASRRRRGGACSRSTVHLRATLARTRSSLKTAAAAVIGAMVQRHLWWERGHGLGRSRAAQRQEVPLRGTSAPGEEQLSDHPCLDRPSEAPHWERGSSPRPRPCGQSDQRDFTLAHDQLTPRQNAQAVDVAAYPRALCASIEAAGR